MQGIKRIAGRSFRSQICSSTTLVEYCLFKSGRSGYGRLPSPFGSRTKYTVSYSHGHDFVEKGPTLVGKTLGQAFDETTEKYPDNVFISCTQDRVERTFYQFQKERDRLAAGLISLEIERGDRVGIWSPNNLEWVLTMMAAARIGAILVNLNPAYQKDEIKYSINKVGMKAIVTSQPFTTQNYYQMLADICPELETATPGDLQSQSMPSLKSVIIMGNEEHPGSFALDKVMNVGEKEHFDIAEGITKRLQFDDIMNIQFTSGTTGHPKATCLTHYHLLNNMVILNYMTNACGPGKVFCGPVPLFHVGGMGIPCLASLFGNTVVLPSPTYDTKMTLHAFQGEKCTGVFLVPTMLIDLLNHPDFATFDLSNLRKIILGGSPIPPEILDFARTRLNSETQIYSGFGMTEAAGCITLVRDTDPKACQSTAGRVAPWFEVKIIDPFTNEVVPPNEPGEMCIKGPCVTLGYWKDDEKTKESIDPAKWLHSGDLATLDEEGYIRIVGRSKDVVIRGGENIFPVQIEDFLYTHPKVGHVEVVGVPDKRLIEELCACIKLKEGEECTEEEIKNFCKGKISHFMVPRYVQFVDEFPMTTSRKVQKFKLREEMINRLEI